MRDIDDGLRRYVSIWKRVPSFAGIILIAQFALVIFVATRISLEYQNDQYLRAYVRSSIQTSLRALQTTLPIFLGVGAIVVYARLLTGRNEDEDEDSLPGDNLTTLERPTAVLYPDEFSLPLVEELLRQIEATPSCRSARTVKTKGSRSGEPIRRSLKRITKRPVSNPDWQC